MKIRRFIGPAYRIFKFNGRRRVYLINHLPFKYFLKPILEAHQAFVTTAMYQHLITMGYAPGTLRRSHAEAIANKMLRCYPGHFHE